MKIEVVNADGKKFMLEVVSPVKFDVDERGALVVSYTHGDVLAIFAPGTWLSAHRVEDVKTED